MIINAKNIVECRVRKGLSLRELSNMSGIDIVTINRLERGLSHPRPKTTKALCDALGVTFDELFKIEEEGD